MTAATPDWLNPVPFGNVGHGELPGTPQQPDVISENQLEQIRKQLLESILSAVVQAVRGLFIPGPFGSALAQLEEWAKKIPFLSDVWDLITTNINDLLDIIKKATGIDLTGTDNFLNWLVTQIGNNVAGVADALRNLLTGIVTGVGQTIDDILDGILALTGLDLRALANFDIFNVIGGLVSTVAGISDWITDAAKNVLDIITNSVNDLLALIKKVTGIDLSILGALNPVKLLTDIPKMIQDLLDGIFGIFGGTAGVGKSVTEALAAISGWFTGIFKPFLTNFTSLVEGLFSLFSGGLSGAGKTVTQMITAISTWLTNIFKPLADGFTALVDGLGKLFGLTGAGLTVANVLTAATTWMTTTFKAVADNVTALINGFFSLFGGTGTASVAGLFTAATTWMTTTFKAVSDGLQAIVNAIISVFGGTGTTVANAVTALTTWMNNIFKPLQTGLQTLINGIVSAFGGTGATVAAAVKALTDWITTGPFKVLSDLIKGLIDKLITLNPANVANGIAGTIDNVFATLGWVLGVGQDAATAAANANAGLEAIMSGQAGGFFDEFLYTMASNLPNTWQKKTALADNYGPDGSGSAVFNAVGNGLGWIGYAQVSKPLLVPDMKCSVVLSKLPSWDLLVRSGWQIKVQASATAGDQSCLQVEINNTSCQFQSVNAAGAVTNLGGAKAIPANALSMPYTLEFKAGTLSLYRNGILAASQTGVTALSGRCVGFGAYKAAYIGGHPCINLAGVSWQPAT